MTEALAAGFADELSPEEKAILNGDTPEKTEAPAEKAEPVKEAKEAPKKEEPQDDDETIELENKGRFVRHGAFHAERQKRKELEKLIEDYRQKETAWARGDERLKVLTESLQKTEQKAEPQKEEGPPDPQTDIFGALNWTINRLNQLDGRVGETAKQAADRAAAQDSDTALRNAYVADVQSFVTKQDDFAQAYAFLMQGRNAELEASGVSDPAKRMAIIVDEEKWLVGMALEGQASPAERLYKLSVARGYKKAEPKVEQKPNDAAEKIAALAKAKDATQSLSNVGGSAGVDALTKEALAAMSEDEFAAIRAKLSPTKFAQIMAG